MWDERDNDDGYYREQMNRDRAHRAYHGRCSTPYCPGGTKQRCEECGEWNASCPCGCCNEQCACWDENIEEAHDADTEPRRQAV